MIYDVFGLLVVLCSQGKWLESWLKTEWSLVGWWQMTNAIADIETESNPNYD